MNEAIVIQIGQCGIQIGESLWELLCREHNIGYDGISKSPQGHTPVLFEESLAGKYVPRTVFVDTESMCLDSLKNGSLKTLFNSSGFIRGADEAASTFARGYYTIGKEFVYTINDYIRKLSEACSRVSSIMLVMNSAGGTGSGLGTLLCEYLSIYFIKVPKIGFLGYPSPNIFTSIIEPYNSIFCTNILSDYIELALMFDNEALYNLYDQAEMLNANYRDINRLLSYSFSSATIGSRFNNSMKNVPIEMIQNLVPYSPLHFTSMTFAPSIPLVKGEKKLYSPSDFSSELLSPFFSQLSCNFRKGKHLSANVTYQGIDANGQTGLIDYETWRKESYRFVNYVPTGVKINANKQPPTCLPSWGFSEMPRSAFAIFNNTAISRVFSNITDNYDKIYSKHAFIHWFRSEGLELGEFSEARETLEILIEQYTKAGLDEEAESPQQLFLTS